MRKHGVVSVIITVILLVGSVIALSYAQTPAPSDTPTFYRLVPGTFVNGYPRFTVSYPKDWVEKTPMSNEVFRAMRPGPASDAWFSIALNPIATPDLGMDRVAEVTVSAFKNWATDITVVGDTPLRLRDGTPAREVELQMVMNGVLTPHLFLFTRKAGLRISFGVGSRSGRIGKDLRAIIHSFEFESDKDTPVKAPTDIQEFLDRYRNDIVSHDIQRFMTHYSDRYLNSGVKKREVEQVWKQRISEVTSYEVRVSEVVSAGDRTYLTGFATTNMRTGPIFESSIIKENGEWKWYGNQRNPVP